MSLLSKPDKQDGCIILRLPSLRDPISRFLDYTANETGADAARFASPGNSSERCAVGHSRSPHELIDGGNCIAFAFENEHDKWKRVEMFGDVCVDFSLEFGAEESVLLMTTMMMLHGLI